MSHFHLPVCWRPAIIILAPLLVSCASPTMLPKTPGVQPVYPPAPAQARYVYERSLYSRTDVLAPATSTAFLKQVLEQKKTLDNSLNRPQAIAVYHGLVFVTTSTGQAINVFDLRRHKFYKIGDQGSLLTPMGVSVGRHNELFVADTTTNTILVFDLQGTYLRRIGGPKWFSHLSNVTADPKTDRIYAIDNGNNSPRIRVFSAIDGRHLFDFGKYGDAAGEFNLPYDLAVGLHGQLYVVDSGNFRIQIFTHQGGYLRSFGTVGRRPGQFLRPKEIATDSQGNLFVVDGTFASIQVYSAQGNFLYVIGQRDQTDGPGHLLMPSGITIDSDDRLYLADQWYGKLEVFRPLPKRAKLAAKRIL